ncbi:unnamed protein product [Oikopleura dioica]|uniref:Uncharacterized protein n=2 Tax=Oikopleura dioica TaxID=34765 RepID=E4YHD4_OIKDI|nr:unnamed protein product [Oikopleura dioica]
MDLETVLEDVEFEEEVYINETELEQTYYAGPEETLFPTVPAPPPGLAPIPTTLHYYFRRLFIHIEYFFVEHWGYFLIGFGIFLVFIIVPGILLQVYCDRLYRKYKREQITRKILEYEAEMERDGADEDNRASRRYQASLESSSSSEESYRHHKRGRRSARKSGKKVRARSRPPVDRKKSPEKTPESSPVAEKPPALPPKESKKEKQEAKKQEEEQKQGSYHHFRHGNGKARFELIRDSGVSMWDQETREIENDSRLQSAENSMPFASTSQKTVNALPYPDQLDHFQTENELSNDFPEHNYQETITASTVTDHRLPTMREETAPSSDHRGAYWSAGIVSQFNGARTPPRPSRSRPEPHNSTQITYDEIREMKQVMPHDQEVKKPSEIQNYNDALNSLSQQNDDTLFQKRAGSSMIPNLMPAPEIGENDSEPPPLPPKESKSILTPVEMPKLDLKRETHLVRKKIISFF